jgi:hypothetical protein
MTRRMWRRMAIPTKESIFFVRPIVETGSGFW